MSNDQRSLFDAGEWWEDEWQGMPEFQQDDMRPYQQIVLNFETKEDVAAFAALLQQKIGPKTDSLWFPFKPNDIVKNRRYVDESSYCGIVMEPQWYADYLGVDVSEVESNATT